MQSNFWEPAALFTQDFKTNKGQFQFAQSNEDMFRTAQDEDKLQVEPIFTGRQTEIKGAFMENEEQNYGFLMPRQA